MLAEKQHCFLTKQFGFTEIVQNVFVFLFNCVQPTVLVSLQDRLQISNKKLSAALLFYLAIKSNAFRDEVGREMWGVEVSHHVCFILQYWGQRM